VATELQSRPQPSPHAPAADGGVVVEKVSRAYRGARGEAVPALSDVSLSAARGELVAVVGPSGCGKTTLLELVPPAVARQRFDRVRAGGADGPERHAAAVVRRR